MTEFGASKKNKFKYLALMAVRETYLSGGGEEHASSSPNNKMDTAEDNTWGNDDNMFDSVNNTADNSVDTVYLYMAGIRKDESEE